MRPPLSRAAVSRRLAVLLSLVVIVLIPAIAPGQKKLDADAFETVTLVVDGVEHAVRGAREGERLYLSMADLADAVGGDWGRDPLSRELTLTVDDDRVLFSSRDRRIAVNGRRRKLSGPVRTGSGIVWVPADFVEDHLVGLVDARLTLIEAAPRPRRSSPPRGMAEAPDDDAAFSGRPDGADDAVRDRDAAADRRRRARREDDLRQEVRDDSGRLREDPSPRSPEGRDDQVRRIVIDPGHGGEEEGAEGPSGLLEKDVVLEVSRRLRIELERRGYDVTLTRTRDVDVPLDERAAVANNRQADLFLSIHANASPSQGARGAETYFLSLDRGARRSGSAEPDSAYLSPDSSGDSLKMILWDMAQSSWLAQSSRVAEIIQAEFNDALDIPDRGVKQAPFRVLVGATMPAVLVEIGFISNPQEEERLRDPDFLNLIVRSLSRSVDAYRDEVRRRRWEGAPSPAGMPRTDVDRP